MSQREDIIKIAQKEIGYKESIGNVTKYGELYGMQDYWCNIFVWWCAKKAGISEDVIPKKAYVPYTVKWFKDKNRYYAKGSYTPQSGDIVIFGSNSHIGFVETVNGNTLTTIEGNTAANANSSNGDGVYRRYRKLTDSWVTGYCVPNYEEEEEMVYSKISEVPSWGQATVNKLIAKGALKGDTTGLNLNETMLRIFVILDRLGKL